MGDRAVLVSTSDAAERERVATVLRGHRPDLGPACDVRRGMRDVLVEVGRPDTGLLERVAGVLASAKASRAAAEEARSRHRIPVRYDGIDTAEVADALGLSVEALVHAHLAQSWRVAMLGFAPGFAYLEPVGEATASWDVLPRRPTPRSRVPRGSVALAAGMSAVYPQAMPGGWHLVGTSDVVLFDPDRVDSPSLLEAGDVVAFVEASS